MTRHLQRYPGYDQKTRLEGTGMARLPEFLIIGAMKAGTTTLYHDLRTHPHVFFPAHKEPHNLCSDEVLQPRGLRDYQAIYRKARADQLCGDASTGYTKLPVRRGVPGRALRVLGTKVRLIYSVREPVGRALSHHYHLFLAGAAPADLERAVKQVPELVDFSRYGMQLQPWIDTFSRERVLVSSFEDYTRDRRAGVENLCSFLGLDAHLDSLQADVAFNAGDQRRRIPLFQKRIWDRALRSRFYRYKLRPLLPQPLIDAVKATVFPAPPPRPRPSPAAIDYLIEALRDDIERFYGMIGCHQPLWDFTAVRERYAGDQIDPAATVDTPTSGFATNDIRAGDL